jgi:hypothetical protein
MPSNALHVGNPDGSLLTLAASRSRATPPRPTTGKAPTATQKLNCGPQDQRPQCRGQHPLEQPDYGWGKAIQDIKKRQGY